MSSGTLFWIISRAAGITALVLASVAVGVGLTMGGKLVKGGAPERRTAHEILSLSTIVAVVVHGLALVGDPWLHPGLLGVTLPFAGSYRTLETSIGIIAGWGLALLGLSYYLRRRIGQRRWRSIHRFTALAWLLGLIHACTEGTDSGRLWFIALIGLTAAPALVLLIVRHLRPQPAARSARRRSAPSPEHVALGRSAPRPEHVAQRGLELGVAKLKPQTP